MLLQLSYSILQCYWPSAAVSTLCSTGSVSLSSELFARTLCPTDGKRSQNQLSIVYRCKTMTLISQRWAEENVTRQLSNTMMVKHCLSLDKELTWSRGNDVTWSRGYDVELIALSVGGVQMVTCLKDGRCDEDKHGTWKAPILTKWYMGYGGKRRGMGWAYPKTNMPWNATL